MENKEKLIIVEVTEGGHRYRSLIDFLRRDNYSYSTEQKAIRTEAEIRTAADAIRKNNNLTYGYKDDVIAVLYWVLGGEPFDG
jgi:hypothetical protein